MRLNPVMQKLYINEIFHSLQGEGGRVGLATAFIRLAGCNLHCKFCDTEFTEQTAMSFNEIIDKISDYHTTWITWTGGEPTLQLNDNIIELFKKAGYKQAIESNGTLPIPHGLDYVTISPKGKQIAQNVHINEYRLIYTEDTLPYTILSYTGKADAIFLSPAFNNNEPNYKLIQKAVNLCKKYPQIRLSVQMHKLINIK
jgi:7-carboxy-7-deazaguanine synthase